MDLQEVLDNMDDETYEAAQYIVGSAIENYINGADDDHDDDYDDGDNGYDNGYEDGYDDAYDEGYDDAYDEMAHSDGGGSGMKYNVFEDDYDGYGGDMRDDELVHAFEDAVIGDIRTYGSLSQSWLAHSEEYGVQSIDWLFPDFRETSDGPFQIYDRDQSWAEYLMSNVGRSAYSRVKSTFADLTGEEARARGYVKGRKKLNQVIALLRRKTDPQTVYKKQTFDQDDLIDLNFDIIGKIKGEMRVKLNEEIARAILIGDGRDASSPDKIFEVHVRPVTTDDSFFTIRKGVVPQGDNSKERQFIVDALKARKEYRGSGRPTLFTTEDMLTDLLLMTDKNGRDLFTSEEQLKTKLRVSNICTVPYLETHTIGGTHILGIFVNIHNDYKVGTTSGGEIRMRENFDIDYNQQKYLIETRCSGALVTPYSAIVLFDGAVPAASNFNESIERSASSPTVGNDETQGG